MMETKMMKANELGVTIDREFILNNVIQCVESTEARENGTGDYIIHDVFDLPSYYRVIIDREKSFRMTSNLMSKFGIGAIELSESAEKNTRANIKIQNLGEFFGAYDPNAPEIVTSKSHEFGAGVIGYTDIYDDLCRKHGAKMCFVLPSSIHEILVHFPQDDIPKEVFDQMVRDVNAAEVAPEEQLADHCYEYHVGDFYLSY